MYDFMTVSGRVEFQSKITRVRIVVVYGIEYVRIINYLLRV